MSWYSQNTERPDVDDVFTALDDDTCRTLVRNLTAPTTAQALAEQCDVPLSTTYRKLKTLEEASLVDPEISFQSDGRHTRHYRTNFDAIVVTLDSQNRLDVHVDRPSQSPDRRVAALWSRLGNDD